MVQSPQSIIGLGVLATRMVSGTFGLLAINEGMGNLRELKADIEECSEPIPLMWPENTALHRPALL